jgi:hypothetical protein
MPEAIFASSSVALPESAAKETPMDFETLMQANLDLVFGERDPAQRILAIRKIYDENAELYEAEGSARGHEAISQAVTEVLEHMPPDFVFTAIRPALGHNGVGRLQWGVGPAGGPFAVTGTDVAHVEGGLIRTLHVFLDPPDF